MLFLYNEKKSEEKYVSNVHDYENKISSDFVFILLMRGNQMRSI